MKCILFQATPRDNRRFLAGLRGYVGAAGGAIEASSEDNGVSSEHRALELRTQRPLAPNIAVGAPNTGPRAPNTTARASNIRSQAPNIASLTRR
jgi:hypothetical protein